MEPFEMEEELRARIAQRAYEIYLSRAGVDQDGSAEDDWWQAEEEFSRARESSPTSTEPDLD